jgi:hypothetical protein
MIGAGFPQYVRKADVRQGIRWLRPAAGVYQQEQAAQAGVEEEAGDGDRDNADRLYGYSHVKRGALAGGGRVSR